ncbi:PLP-dependent transferase, partial [Staphylococcus saprophyticus]|uniref:PLP-dependent transferase n=1 Tax=Staphylococcus saprophyticus TaxID=29385 RepID=UPI001642D7A4
DGGQRRDRYRGGVRTSIYETSRYMEDGIGEMREGYEYCGWGNGRGSGLEGLIGDLEEGESGFGFGSGMGGI